MRVLSRVGDALSLSKGVVRGGHAGIVAHVTPGSVTQFGDDISAGIGGEAVRAEMIAKPINQICYFCMHTRYLTGCRFIEFQLVEFGDARVEKRLGS